MSVDTMDIREWLYRQSDDAVVNYIHSLRELSRELFIALPPEKLNSDFGAWYESVMDEIVEDQYGS